MSWHVPLPRGKKTESNVWTIGLALVLLASPMAILAHAQPAPSSSQARGVTAAGSAGRVSAAPNGASPRAPAATLSGIDVSGYQGASINWASVKSAGNSFAFARAVEYYGVSDTDFATNMANGKAAGVYMGAYDFVYPSSESSTSDADYFNSIIKPYVASGYMYPALDLEKDCSASGGTMSASQITTWVNGWGTELEADLATDGFPGVHPIVYMNSNYANNCIVASSWGGWSLWIAEYYNTCATSPAPNTGVFSTYAFWQWCSTGSSGGISPVDQDVFNGGLSQLQGGYLFGLSVSYAMKDLTTNTVLYCGGSFLTGDNIQFTGSATGGSGTYTYAWKFGDGSTGSGNPATHVYSATGTVDPMLTVTDSNGASATTGSGCSFTVNAGLSVSTPLSASPNPVVIYNSTTFTVTASGGTSPYSYSYSGLPGGCISGSTNSLGCTPSVAGAFPVKVTVTDAAGRTATSSTTLTVTAPALVAGPLTATPATIVLNGTTNLSITVSGGVPPYSYAYSGLPSGCASSNVSLLACTPTQTGTFTVSVTVSDRAAQTQQANTTLTVVASALIVGPLVASPPTVAANTTTNLSVLASGGVPPYTYVYAGLPPGCLSSNASSVPCQPTVPGTFNVSVTVSDRSGQTQTANTTVIVTPDALAITSFAATPSRILLGNNTTLAGATSGGIGPYTYVYGGLPNGCSSVNATLLLCTPVAFGSFNVTWTVTDGQGASQEAWTILTVTEGVVVTGFSIQPSPLAYGNVTQLRVTVQNGTPPYAYAYRGLPTGCTSKDASNFSCTPLELGTFNVTVVVQDANHLEGVGTARLVVVGALVLTGFVASPAVVTLGNSSTLTVTVAGGAPPYSYTYSGLPEGCATESTGTLPCKPTVTGNFSIIVSVADTSGSDAHRSLVLQVVSPPPPTHTTSPTSGLPGGLPIATLALLGVLVATLVVGAILIVHRRRKRSEAPPPAWTPAEAPAGVEGAPMTGSDFPPP